MGVSLSLLKAVANEAADRDGLTPSDEAKIIRQFNKRPGFNLAQTKQAFEILKDGDVAAEERWELTTLLQKGVTSQQLNKIIGPNGLAILKRRVKLLANDAAHGSTDRIKINACQVLAKHPKGLKGLVGSLKKAVQGQPSMSVARACMPLLGRAIGVPQLGASLLANPVFFRPPYPPTVYQLATANLILSLNNPSSEVRLQAARALGMLRARSAVPALMQTIKDRVDSFYWQVYHDALVKIGQPAVPALIQALKHRAAYVRRSSVLILREIKDRRAVPALIKALKDTDKDVRMIAALTLGESKDRRAVPSLIQALKDRDDSVRIQSACALGEFKDRRAVPVLIQALKNRFPLSAVHALEKIGQPAVPSLIQALKNRDRNVRSEAADILRRLGVKVR